MLTYLEDFIEYISGFKDRNGQATNFWFGSVSQVRLANYDVAVVSGLGDQTNRGVALTDRQVQLAQKIVNKYRRQLAMQGITVPETLGLRMPARVVDRSSVINYSVEKSEFQVRFPYNAKLIDGLREFSRISCGQVIFNPTDRYWAVAASVPNLVFINNWGRENGFTLTFDVDTLLEELYNNITVPLLTYDTHEVGRLTVKNNPGTMDETVLQQPGKSLLDALVQAGTWQIPVDSSVVQAAQAQGFSDQWIEWSTKRMLHVRPDQVSLEDFFSWVNTTQLWPVIWNSSSDLDIVELKSLLGADRVLRLEDSKIWGNQNLVKERTLLYTPVLANNRRVLSATVARRLEEIGVLVTRQSIIYQIKNQWGSKSRKIVYWGDKLLSELIT